MIKIVPDKEGRLTQWDLNRKVIVTGYEGVAEVHFASPGDDHGAYVVELIDGEAEIPNILLTMAGTINVYLYPDDRTVFATTLWVMAREKPDDYIYTETEVLSYKTLDEKIGDLAKLTTTARENLVAAINEAATKGMASIYMRVAEGYIEYSGDGVNWKQLIAVAELKGDKGDKGDPGSDATVEIVTPTAESTDTQAASAKAVWDISGDLSTLKTTAKDNLVNALNEVHDSIGSGGSGGTDISLGLTGAAVGDIIKVKSVDESGKPTEWEAAEMLSGSKPQLLKDVVLSEQAAINITDFDNTLNEYLVIIGMNLTEKLTTNIKLFGTSGSDYYVGADSGNVVMSLYYRIFGNVMWMVRDVNKRAIDDFSALTEPPGSPSSHNNSNIRSGAYKIADKSQGLKTTNAFPAGTHIWIYGV